MFKSIKINTAFLVFLAFLFRLFFINSSLVAATNSPQNSSFLKSHFSSVLKKRRKNPEANVKTTFEKYSVVEVCEEDSDDEENLVKFSVPVLLFYLFSFFKKISSSPGSNNPFDSIKCNLFPKKYLALSILRI